MTEKEKKEKRLKEMEEFKKLYLDNSGRSTYRQCKMKYFLQYVKGLQSDYGSTALRYGTCWHKIQEVYHSYVIEHGWPKNNSETVAAMTQAFKAGKEIYDKLSAQQTYYDDYKNFNTAVTGFNAYLEYFKTDKDYMKVIATEKKLEYTILPESKEEEKVLSTIPELVFTGKIDLCVMLDNVPWLLDFKTTGWYLEKVIQQANRSPQLLGYSYVGKRVFDFEPQGCLCSFSYINSTKSKKTGNWGNVRHKFRRVPQLFSEGDLKAWKASFIDTAKDITTSRKENIWTQSFDNCYQYGVCPYLVLCNQHSDFEDLNTKGFHVNHWDVLED